MGKQEILSIIICMCVLLKLGLIVEKKSEWGTVVKVIRNIHATNQPSFKKSSSNSSRQLSRKYYSLLRILYLLHTTGGYTHTQKSVCLGGEYCTEWEILGKVEITGERGKTGDAPNEWQQGVCRVLRLCYGLELVPVFEMLNSAMARLED